MHHMSMGTRETDQPPLWVALERADQLVQSRVAGRRPQPHVRTYVGCAVSGALDDPREREPALQVGDTALEERLLVQGLCELEVLAGLAAVLARVAQPAGDLGTPDLDELVELGLQALAPLARDRTTELAGSD